MGIERRAMQHAWNRRQIHEKSWSENLQRRSNMVPLGLDGQIILKMTLKIMCEDVEWSYVIRDFKYFRR
jgi:hypothetical protein